MPYWVEMISDWSLYHLRPPRKLSASKSLTSSSERSSSGRSGQRGWSSPTKAAHWEETGNQMVNSLCQVWKQWKNQKLDSVQKSHQNKVIHTFVKHTNNQPISLWPKVLLLLIKICILNISPALMSHANLSPVSPSLPSTPASTHHASPSPAIGSGLPATNWCLLTFCYSPATFM